MSEYAAFLRGVNVGSAHRVTSGELRSCFEEAGLRDVATFRTSGNVAFDADGAPADELRDRIEGSLESALGYPVAVFLRTGKEMRAIAAHEPFPAKVVAGSKGKVQVSLLAKKPAAGARKEVLAFGSDEDRLAFHGREFYWLPSGGMSDSHLDLNTIDKLLGVTTRRTKNTVELMTEKYFGG